MESRTGVAPAGPCHNRGWLGRIHSQISFLSSRSKSRGDHDEQVKPQNAHKMPVNCGAFEQTPSRRPFAGSDFCNQVRQCRDAAEKMKNVHNRENIEKGTVRVCSEVEASSSKLPP